MTLGSLLLILFIPLLFNLCTAWIWIKIGIRKAPGTIRCEWEESRIFNLSVTVCGTVSVILLYIGLIFGVDFLVNSVNMILW